MVLVIILVQSCPTLFFVSNLVYIRLPKVKLLSLFKPAEKNERYLSSKIFSVNKLMMKMLNIKASFIAAGNLLDERPSEVFHRFKVDDVVFTIYRHKLNLFNVTGINLQRS